MDIKARLTPSKRLVIQVNPQASRTHQLRVVAKLRLDDSFEPVLTDLTTKDWKALLDHFDSDDSVGLRRGVFYLEGDIAEVDRFEAAALLTFLPDYFEPHDDHTQALLDALQGSEPAEDEVDNQ